MEETIQVKAPACREQASCCDASQEATQIHHEHNEHTVCTNCSSHDDISSIASCGAYPQKHSMTYAQLPGVSALTRSDDEVVAYRSLPAGAISGDELVAILPNGSWRLDLSPRYP